MLGEVMRNEIHEIPNVFGRLISNTEQFQRVAAQVALSDIHSVIIVARGTSDNAALFLKYLIETKLGLPVGLASPSAVSLHGTQLHYKGVLLVAISQSGQSPDLIAFSRASIDSGALMIAITNDSHSPLSQMAHLNLELLAAPEIAVAATKSYVAQLLVSYLLVCALEQRVPEVNNLVDATREILSRDIASSVDSCDLRHEILVLGRGYSYANAREAALKIQETCKVPVQGFSSADYLHGPISALRPSTQVLLIAPNKMPIESMADTLERIRSYKPKVFWIGEGGVSLGNEKAIGGSSIENEIVASIVDAVLMQRFVLELAVRNGLNPDKPAGLSKVTLTL